MRAWIARLAALVACLVAAPGVAQAGDATTFQLNPAHTGYSPDSLGGSLQLRWSVELGRQVSYPLIAEGKVFVIVQGVPVPGAPYPVYVVFALDQATGAVIWKRPLAEPGEDPSPLAYDAGRIFVAMPYDDLEQHTIRAAIDAYDAGSGERLWRHAPDGDSWIFKGPPVAADGVLYVTGSGGGGWIYAVRQSDGERLWTQGISGGAQSVTLSPTRVYAPEACDVWSFNRADGAPAWRHDGGCTGGGERLAPLFGGRLYGRQAFGGKVFDADGGQEVGAFDVDPVWDPPPAFAGHTRVQVNGGVVNAFDVQSGTRLWTFAGDGTRASAPVIAGDVVYVGTGAGRVYGIDLATGQERWRGDAGAPVRPSDQWDNSTIPGLGVGAGMLVVPASGRLVAFAGAAATGPGDRAKRPSAVRVRVRCRARCRALIELKLARRLARRYSLDRVVGSRRVILAAGPHSVKVKLRRAAVARLAGLARVRVTATVELVPQGSTRHRSRQVLLLQNRRD
jgi:outer membrane protein assembly factor BamB